MEGKPYALLIGSVMYAQVCTRLDLAFAIGMLSRNQSNPGIIHWNAGKRLLRYLKKTRDYMLTYRRVDNLELVGYSDSDLGRDKDEGKSTSGFIFMLAGGAISWRSIKQKAICTSTMQAEFAALHEATVHGIWLKNFISQTHLVDSIERPITIYCDNTSAVFFAKNNKRSSSSKQIPLKQLFVRQKTRSEEIVVPYIETANMLADPLTKALANKDFIRHTFNMGLVASFNLIE
ncbi:secreted RxLR effector protein 161-like [Rosa rugosa]|uniref:secreted RxLR effector protein 161-like n=1 Tax=Rosa rugosa TaxID=74645 RepID=UPI002B40F264|nr:secreted RxLR effector protein 161-like [Rosa rugosa]